jgi:hypothetical protein
VDVSAELEDLTRWANGERRLEGRFFEETLDRRRMEDESLQPEALLFERGKLRSENMTRHELSY